MSILNILDRVSPRWDGREIEWGDWEPRTNRLRLGIQRLR